MGVKILILFAILALVFVHGGAEDTETTTVKKVKGKKVCKKKKECTSWSEHCCNSTISDIFDSYQFANLFPNINSPVAHANGFWDYHSFITASYMFQPLGFGTTGGKDMQLKELAAFFGHVGSKTSCGYAAAKGGQYAWGLCYKKELSPSQSYCDEYYKLTYPCSPGAEYYGRGAIPLYWNYNYGEAGDALQADLLNHPEYIEQNATLAFQAAIWRWVTPMKKSQPSAHEVIVGKWEPTKNDTLSKRVPGFGTTMNILYGDIVCGKGEDDSMKSIILHYLHYLEVLGLGQDRAGPEQFLSCAEQIAFNPSSSGAKTS